MSLRSELEQWYVKIAPGMNNKTEDLDLAGQWVELAQNCRFEEEPKAVVKRDPVTYYNTDFTGLVGGDGDGAVTGLYRFYTSNGGTQFIMVHKTTCYVGSDLTNTWTPIRTGLADGKRMSFETYQDQCIMSNGFDNIFVYDGDAVTNTTWELGACKATVGTGTGITATDISYKITYDNDTVITGAVSNTLASATNEDILLTNIPLGPPATVNRKIYRKDSNTSGNYYYVATLPDNSDEDYTDADNDLTLPNPPGPLIIPPVTGSGGDAIPKGSIIKIHRERLFITGDPNAPSTIYFSNTYLPQFIQVVSATDYLEISPDDNDEIMGIPIQLGVMMCIKKNSIRRLHVSDPGSGADPNTWYADDPTAWVGSPAQWSITQTQYGIIFLGWDSWYRFDGSKAEKIFDEFDTSEILPSTYSDTVGFYHKGSFIAAYSDNTTAAQSHNRIMRYNFQRVALSIDLWTSTTLTGANCFASKTGDDETGELYYGDSVMGYVVKAKEGEESYRLRTQTDCNNYYSTTPPLTPPEDDTHDIFVGGTENSPYIEIGGEGSSAVTVPADVIIFWDSESTTPGSGWTDITTTYDGKFVYMDSVTGSPTTSDTPHSHSIAGSLDSVTLTGVESGDQDHLGGTYQPHGHTFNGAADNESPYPRYIKLRVFKSDGTGGSEFPTGAIVMWDQSVAPTGWQNYGTDGHYIRIGATGLGTPNASAHDHDYSFNSDLNTIQNGNLSTGSDECSKNQHYHSISGTATSKDQSDWELGYTSFNFIKKVGESASWDGQSQYVYCCVEGTSNPTASDPGWELVGTYNASFLKVGAGSVIGTGAASNASHTHDFPGGTSGTDPQPEGNAYYRTHNFPHHTHPYSGGTSGSGTSAEPGRVSWRMYRKLLGHMKSYNDATNIQYTEGTWVSPAQQIDAETMTELFWNELITAPSTDDVLFYTRAGSSQALCEAATWSAALTDPNGSDILTVANTWFQYKIEFTALDTRDDNPRVYHTNAYVVKYTYEKGDVVAETSVNFHYDIGFRNFNFPMADKLFKKIQTVHEGVTGSFNVGWTTEHSSDSFTVDLTSFAERWESYFQSTAMGRKIDFKFSKNDLNDFKIKELKGLYTREPIVL